MLDYSVLPRPEYPRPDRQRSFVEGHDWLNLNGPWQFRFDGERDGHQDRWFDPATGGWEEQIIVPFCWESLAAWGQGDAAGSDNYYATRVFRDPLAVTRLNHRSAPRYEVGWYRRDILIPRTGPWADKRVILTVGAADFFTDGWCNGRHLGHHEGGYTPFEFDLTDSLHKTDSEGFARAVIVLRVEDPMNNAEQPVGKQWRWYTTTSGIWQTVFVEPRHATHFRHFRIAPNLDQGTASFHLPCSGAHPGDTMEVEIRPPDGSPALVKILEIDPVAHAAFAEIEAPGRVVWDHVSPELYYVRLRIRRAGGKVLDEVQTYFGLRKISTGPALADGARADDTAPAALCLNNQPVYLRGALHQSFYPDGVYTAGDAAVLRNDIAYAKKSGFDFLRIHIKIDDPLLLHYADTMGILLMLDFPNFGEGGDTPLGRRRYEDMMRRAIERDFNHPSVIAWCLFNETWGFGGQVELVKLFGPDGRGGANGEEMKKLANQEAAKWVQHTWELAKSLDPTRLIEDMSVVFWEHLDYYAHGDTDINSWHFYVNDYARAREHIEKVVNSTYAGSMFNYAEGYAQKQQPLITSEYGGIGALDGDVDVSWSFKFLTNELRRQPKLSAYVFTQLHDVEWEYNGFLNYDRTAKDFGYDPRIINHSDVLPMDAAPIARRQPGERARVEISSSHYARRERAGVTLDWRLSGVDALGRILPDLARGGGPIPYPARLVAPAAVAEFSLPSGDLPTLCQLSVAARTGDGETLAQNFVEFFVTDGYPAPRREVEGGDTVLFAAPSDWAAAGWSERLASREEAARDDRTSGLGTGFFEWHLPMDGLDLGDAWRLRVLVEASSCRVDTPQTDVHTWPTALEILLNGFPIYQGGLPNHPHDARGSLSYLRGGRGAYGYLTRATVEGDLLRRIAEAGAGGHLRLRCAVPAETLTPGGLVIYGPECGRYPFGLSVIVER